MNYGPETFDKVLRNLDGRRVNVNTLNENFSGIAMASDPGTTSPVGWLRIGGEGGPVTWIRADAITSITRVPDESR